MHDLLLDYYRLLRRHGFRGLLFRRRNHGVHHNIVSMLAMQYLVKLLCKASPSWTAWIALHVDAFKEPRRVFHPKPDYCVCERVLTRDQTPDSAT